MAKPITAIKKIICPLVLTLTITACSLTKETFQTPCTYARQLCTYATLICHLATDTTHNSTRNVQISALLDSIRISTYKIQATLK